jgi:hypothetical protein
MSGTVFVASLSAVVISCYLFYFQLPMIDTIGQELNIFNRWIDVGLTDGIV